MLKHKIVHYLLRIKEWIHLFPVPLQNLEKWYDRILGAVPIEKLVNIEEFRARGGVIPKDFEFFVSNGGQVPRDLLSDNQKFWRDGGNENLFSFSEVRDNNVIVLGGYLGISVERYLQLGAQTIDVFEPIPAFYEELKTKFQSQKKINMIQKAAWIRDENLKFWLDGDGTGFSGKEGTSVKVQGISFSKWLGGQGQNKKFFVEMNIEGSEYDLLEDLISTGEVARMSTLLLQFHNFSEKSELQRAILRDKLTQTHVEIFNYPWVWEKWALKQNN